MDMPNFSDNTLPVFKGFLIQLIPQNSYKREGTVHKIIKQIVDRASDLSIFSRLSDWKDNLTSVQTDDLIRIFLDSKSHVSFSSGKAWDITYFLRGLHGVDVSSILYVEPMFATSTNSLMWNEVLNEVPHEVLNEVPHEVPNEVPSEPNKTYIQTFSEYTSETLKTDGSSDLPQTSDPILRAIKVPEAWDAFFKVKEPGAGVIIAHPDTGYQLHPEIMPNLLLDRGRDFIDGDDTPIDEFNRNLLKDPQANLGHGTSTASVIISPPGAQSADKNISGVTGVAYGAKLIPLRISPSVLLREMLEPDLPRAIEYATDQGAHVISISMGGLPTFGLRKAIINAQKQGVIVLASAGNGFPFVVWPAAYDSVIAVASSNKDHNKIADHSCKGSRVDVAAPGEDVLCATVKIEENEQQEDIPVNGTKLGNGTSFAVALVAGVAALWLSYWGRDYLESKYGLARIPLVFDKLLRQTANPPDGWDTEVAGAGIINAHALLSAELPDSFDPIIQVPLAFRQAEHVKLDRGGIDTFEQLYDDIMSNPEFSTLLQTFLSSIFGKTNKELRQYLRVFGQELTFHIGTNLKLFNLLKNALQTTPSQDSKANDQEEVLMELQLHASDYLKEYLLNSLTNIGNT
jgi:serine protease